MNTMYAKLPNLIIGFHGYSKKLMKLFFITINR